MHFIKVALFGFSILLHTQIHSQGIQKRSLLSINKDSLKIIYGHNKDFEPSYELQSLIALSFYPELINTKITFKLASIESIAKTTITTFSILNNSDKHFIIYINKDKSSTGITLEDAPFNAQVGAIGHELAHIFDFNKKNFLGMIWWAIKYVTRKSRINIERKTDIATIQHGLGIELYYFVDFILNHSPSTEKYKAFKRLNYLSPDEILKRTKNSEKNLP